MLCSISRLEIRVRKANDNTLGSIKLVMDLTPAIEREGTGQLSRTAEVGKSLGDHHTSAHETELLTVGVRAQQQCLVDSLSHPQKLSSRGSGWQLIRLHPSLPRSNILPMPEK